MLPTSDGAPSTLRGILFRSTIRGGHASLAIVPSSTEEDENSIVMVIVQLGGNQWHKKETDGCESSEQFSSDVAVMRSNIKRMCKLGNELEFIGNYSHPSNDNNDVSTTNTTQKNKDWNTWRKFVVSYNLQASQNNVKVSRAAKWDAARCQRIRSKFFDDSSKRKQQPPAKKKRRENNYREGMNQHDLEQHTSAKGKQKRIQGEVLADFVLWMLSTITDNEDDNDNGNFEQSAELGNVECNSFEKIGLKKLPTDQNYLFISRWKALHPSLASSSSSAVVKARNKLVIQKFARSSAANERMKDDCNNNHQEKTIPHFPLGGILDAAGGAGHVSLALSLREIQSTIVDPRPTIGKLPGRDRKVLKKSKTKVPFSTYRAWFGSKPNGVDTIYREGRTSLETFLPESERGIRNPLGLNDNGQDLPICSMSSEDKLLPSCVAIVALHPDEATGVIVQTAVLNKIPFGKSNFLYMLHIAIHLLTLFIFQLSYHVVYSVGCSPSVKTQGKVE